MQRWLIVVAVVTGLAVVAISLGMRARVDGGAAREASRISLHAEREAKPGRKRGAPASGAPASPLITHGGLDARLHSLRGRPIVLNAWASWCPPCREELPLFAKASARFGQRSAFLGADVEDGAASARRLLDEVPLGYPSYTTSLADLHSLAPTTGTPFTIFIDRDGQVVGAHFGPYRTQEELDADVASLVAR